MTIPVGVSERRPQRAQPTPVRVLGPGISGLLRGYYLGPDHPGKLRFWWWLRRVTRHPRLTVRLGGGWITVDERDCLQAQIFTQGAYEPEVWEALAAFAIGDETVWDVGANVGAFAVAALADARVAAVHAFEPEPDVGAVLRHNLALNGGRFEVHRLALSDRDEQRSLARGASANLGLAGFRGDHNRGSVVVDCRSIDQLVFGEGLTPPTLLKLDVEGWESHVLTGARRLLSERPPRAVVFETDWESEASLEHDAAARLLRAAGYRISRLRRPDGTIEARENLLAVHRQASTAS